MRNAWHVCDRPVCASVINHTKSNGRISMGAADLAAGSGCVIYAPMSKRRRRQMSWTTPTLVEICVGLEINGYLPAEF
jgi:coenzyme PQQ precursor peptide PqqA